MPFFPPLEDAPEPPEPHEWTPPVWHQPDEDEIPVTAGNATLIARSEDAALVLEPVDVFSAGLRLPLRIVMRRRPGEAQRDWFDRQRQFFGPYGRLGPRLGVRLADGTALLGDHPMGPPDTEPDGPRLTTVGGWGGGGGNRRWEQRIGLWLWPFPEGSFQLVADWASEGIPEAECSIDAEPLSPLRARVTRLWG